MFFVQTISGGKEANNFLNNFCFKKKPMFYEG